MNPKPPNHHATPRSVPEHRGAGTTKPPNYPTTKPLRKRKDGKPIILLPSNGVIPPLLPPSPLTSPEIDAFCRLLAEIVESILIKEQTNEQPTNPDRTE